MERRPIGAAAKSTSRTPTALASASKLTLAGAQAETRRPNPKSPPAEARRGGDPRADCTPQRASEHRVCQAEAEETGPEAERRGGGAAKAAAAGVTSAEQRQLRAGEVGA